MVGWVARFSAACKQFGHVPLQLHTAALVPPARCMPTKALCATACLRQRTACCPSYCVQLRAAFMAADGASALRELLDNPSDRASFVPRCCCMCSPVCYLAPARVSPALVVASWAGCCQHDWAGTTEGCCIVAPLHPVQHCFAATHCACRCWALRWTCCVRCAARTTARCVPAAS